VLTPTQDDEADARVALQRAVGDAFEISERIGRGGYADVFRAFDPRLKRTVAIKALRRDLAATPELRSRFRREAESIAALRHPNLLPIHDIGQRGDTLYLVLEHIRGESLEQYIRREHQAPIDEAVRIIREVAGALAAAHAAGVVHRDLKPANIMLEGAERRALLMDFGLAVALGDGNAELMSSSAFIGTPHYLSPEQAAGDTADHRADIYALGVVAYELVAGQPPFNGDTTAALLMQHLTSLPTPLRHVRADCPAHVAHAIERCLAKSPRERWQAADAFADALVTVDLDEAEERPVLEDGRAASRRAFRAAIALGAMVTVAALAIDIVSTGAPSWSLLVLALAPLALVLRYARFWREGHDLASLLGRDGVVPKDSEQEEFGRHSAAVREARRDRARIVRVLSALTRLEQQQLRQCGPAADALLSRCIQHARQMRSLDQQISGERARTQPGRSHKLLSELLTTREHTADAQSRVLARLAALRDLVERSQSGAYDVSLELTQLLAEGGQG